MVWPVWRVFPVLTELKACSFAMLSCTILFARDATPYGVNTLKPPVCQFSDESI